MAQKDRFYSPQSGSCVRGSRSPGVEPYLKKKKKKRTPFFLSVSFRLSRACLGKMIVSVCFLTSGGKRPLFSSSDLNALRILVHGQHLF